MKKCILLFSFTALGLILNAQSYAVKTLFEDWRTTGGSQNYFYRAVTKTDGSGNVYVAGATLNGNGNYDMLVQKFNSGGVLQWTDQYNGAGNKDDGALGLI